MITASRSAKPAAVVRLRARRCFTLAVLACTGAAPLGAQTVTVQRELAEAGVSRETFLERKPSVRQFEFNGGKATLRADGTWRHEALIRHSGLRCGTYRLSLRFGVGRPGCLDVRWVSPAALAPPLKHCNNAERLHFGDGFGVQLQERFEEINCAEQSAHCSGVCNVRLSPRSDDKPYRFGDDSLR